MERPIIFEKGRLTCVGHDHTKIPAVLARLHGASVECLDLSDNKLVSLQGLEQFPILKELVVDNNCLSENANVPFLPNLTTLSINKNKILNLDLFLRKITAASPDLRFLSLLGNPACPDQLSDSSHDEEDYARYRCYVLHHLPRLLFLDSSTVLKSEVSEAKQRGHLLRVAKPQVRDDKDASPRLGNSLTPLPRTRREIGDHQGAYGKCRYKYSGKHSEESFFGVFPQTKPELFSEQ